MMSHGNVHMSAMAFGFIVGAIFTLVVIGVIDIVSRIAVQRRKRNVR